MALEKAQTAVVKHAKLAEKYPPHHTVGHQARQILDKLNRIVRYHQYRINKIKKGHANRDPYESMRINVSTSFSEDAHTCADMDPHAMRPALTRLSGQAEKLPFFSKKPKQPTIRQRLRTEALFREYDI